eukprot:TRINITY_DN3046_c0_g1_i1.p1 TRINITY_DN3046_c0_g1~~TRINITY_DN3046_c0_g1_i1.p1  ORF type:complete len:333 (+),score=97.74 TRINITY_DN3046_c0_g1_i1:29-1000(+)
MQLHQQQHQHQHQQQQHTAQHGGSSKYECDAGYEIAAAGPGLRTFPFQVGGHSNLLSRSGMVFKPLNRRELDMYRHLAEAKPAFAQFTCACFGRSDLPPHELPAAAAATASDIRWSKQQHTVDAEKQQQRSSYLVIQDLTAPYEHPSIMDLKVGVRQHLDDATPEKKASQMLKCEASTSSTLGFRLCGMLTYDRVVQKYHFVDKYVGRRARPEELHSFFLKFFHNGERVLYDMIAHFVAKLERLLECLAADYHYRMYSSSVLLLYDGAADDPAAAKADIRVVDFAHTYIIEGSEPSDDGVLLGIRNVIAILRPLTHPPCTITL